MRCPVCGHIEDRVLETRIQREGEAIKRRRQCLRCLNRYTTMEVLYHGSHLIIKKDGRREPFSREKVLKGLQAACQKRPVSLSQMEQVVDTVVKWVTSQSDREIPSKEVGKIIIKELKILDEIAYVRFASVYKTFRDVNEFVTRLTHDESAN